MTVDWLTPVEGTLTQQTSLSGQLAHILSQEYSGLFKVSMASADIVWTLFFQEGNLTYASQSGDMADRLDRHLRKLSKRVPKLTKEVRSECRQTLANLDSGGDTSPDYQMIATLVSRQYLTEDEAGVLIKGLVMEVLETCLLAHEGTFHYLPGVILQPKFCSLKLQPLIEACEKRYRQWKQFEYIVWSPYQRPFFQAKNASVDLLPEAKSKQFSQILKGFSFRHLSVLLNCDEIALVKNLLPLIQKQVIILRPPQSPYDQLPNIRDYTKATVDPKASGSFGELETGDIGQKSYTIACIDDSPSILKTIYRYLENDSLNIVQINEPTKALLEIVRSNPDLILMDVGMPKIDGYAICRMLRKHANFRLTPIIMVTGNKGLIDRAKAKMAGATDYMTKPFTQEGLNDMVFRYLTD